MINFLELFNAVAGASWPTFASGPGATSMDDRLTDIGVDSLDGMIVLLYLGELYGIDQATMRKWRPTTVGEVYRLLMAHKTREPASVASALEQIR